MGLCPYCYEKKIFEKKKTHPQVSESVKNPLYLEFRRSHAGSFYVVSNPHLGPVDQLIVQCKFDNAIYISIPPPQRASMGPHWKLGIYVCFEIPSIIKYLEPMIGDLHMARYVDSIFNKDHFPALGEKSNSNQTNAIK